MRIKYTDMVIGDLRRVRASELVNCCDMRLHNIDANALHFIGDAHPVHRGGMRDHSGLQPLVCYLS